MEQNRIRNAKTIATVSQITSMSKTFFDVKFTVSDDAAKNESLIGKRKDKKDKKDKEKGYAALEGESSGDENSKSR